MREARAAAAAAAAVAAASGAEERPPTGAKFARRGRPTRPAVIGLREAREPAAPRARIVFLEARAPVIEGQRRAGHAVTLGRTPWRARRWRRRHRSGRRAPPCTRRSIGVGERAPAERLVALAAAVALIGADAARAADGEPGGGGGED